MALRAHLVSGGLLALGFMLSGFAAQAANVPQQAPLCASCHGQGGISSSPGIPNLAGQKQAYLARALQDYKGGLRKGPSSGMMAGIAAQLSSSDMQALAAFYAGMKPN